jgi:hypothetical protein
MKHPEHVEEYLEPALRQSVAIACSFDEPVGQKEGLISIFTQACANRGPSAVCTTELQWA